MHGIQVRAALPGERVIALAIVFQDLHGLERGNRIESALHLLEVGQLHPDGFFVASRDGEIVGALLCMATPGACGLIWPPRLQSSIVDEETEDRLVMAACGYLACQGVKLAQCLLQEVERPLAKAFDRCGFLSLGNLEYMRHDLHPVRTWWQMPQSIEWESFATCDPKQFAWTLEETYEGSEDCPEMNGIRTVDEILEGHRSQGRYQPLNWLIARMESKPAGVLLLADMPDTGCWDITYLGVVPSMRRRQLGRALTRRALQQGWLAGTSHVTLSVDGRNHAALHLYRSEGFVPFDRRIVYLANLTAGAV